MASKIGTIADAVLAFINNATQQTAYGMPFTATREATPLDNLEDLGDVNVTVVSLSRTRNWMSRHQSQKIVPVMIGVRKKLDQGSDPADTTGNAEIDSLIKLLEDIEDSFVPGALGATGAVLYPEDESTITIDYDSLRGKLFMGWITLSFFYAD